MLLIEALMPAVAFSAEATPQAPSANAAPASFASEVLLKSLPDEVFPTFTARIERISGPPAQAAILAEKDIPDALAYLQSLPENTPDFSTRLAWQNVMLIWTRQDPAAAAASVQNRPDNSVTTSLVNTVSSAWSAQDSPAALKWAESLPPGSKRQIAIKPALLAWAHKDGPAAWNYVLSKKDGALSAGNLPDILYIWSRKDPAAAANAFAALPDEVEGIRPFYIVNSIVQHLQRLGAGTALTWIDTLPQGALRDAADKRMTEMLRSRSMENFAFRGSSTIIRSSMISRGTSLGFRVDGLLYSPAKPNGVYEAAIKPHSNGIGPPPTVSYQNRQFHVEGMLNSNPPDPRQ